MDKYVINNAMLIALLVTVTYCLETAMTDVSLAFTGTFVILDAAMTV
jgi:hypothetical protein